MPHLTPDFLSGMTPGQFVAHVHYVYPEFAKVYEDLAENGWCDSFGGMESRRVYSEWLEAGCPTCFAPFIVERTSTEATP